MQNNHPGSILHPCHVYILHCIVMPTLCLVSCVSVQAINTIFLMDCVACGHIIKLVFSLYCACTECNTFYMNNVIMHEGTEGSKCLCHINFWSKLGFNTDKAMPEQEPSYRHLLTSDLFTPTMLGVIATFTLMQVKQKQFHQCTHEVWIVFVQYLQCVFI